MSLCSPIFRNAQEVKIFFFNQKDLQTKGDAAILFLPGPTVTDGCPSLPSVSTMPLDADDLETVCPFVSSTALDTAWVSSPPTKLNA